MVRNALEMSTQVLGVNTLNVAVSLEAFYTKLYTVATMLVATKSDGRLKLTVIVDPNSACLELVRNSLGLLRVFRPDRSVKSKFRLVCSADDICFL
jgi:hypothetical protein